MRHYGWTPDLPDGRDHPYLWNRNTFLPEKVDLRAQCSPVEDQGQLGSCTANAIVGALEFLRAKQSLPVFDFSRLFVYYNERAMEGTIKSDAGAMIRDGIKSVAKQGCCHETMWPYDVAKFARKPNKACYADALHFEAISYRRVNGLLDMRAALAAGTPVVFGFTVYESFESATVARTGVMPMPDLKKERCLGGHAVLAVGYDALRERLTVRNSWGTNWGQKGYFTMPFGMVTDRNLSDDFWTITQGASA